MAMCLRVSFAVFLVGLAIGTPCPAISNTTFQLADVLVEWEANTNIQHGIEFEDVNGDGLVDMIYGWDDGSNVYITCVYLNTGYSWVPQGGEIESSIGCAATTFIRVRDTRISFKKQSVGQLRQTVAAEFGLRTEDVAVLGRGGVKFGQTTLVGDLFPKGFEVHIRDLAGNRDVAPEVYSCP